MSTLKLNFEKTVFEQKKNETDCKLVFKGSYGPSSDQSQMQLIISKVSKDRRDAILEILGIQNEGEVIFIVPGENPQKTIDEFLKKAVKRKAPKVSDFEKEIEALDDEMLRERYDMIYADLMDLVRNDKAETKECQFFLECFNVLREKIWKYEEPTTMDALKESIGYGYSDTENEDLEEDWETEEE